MTWWMIVLLIFAIFFLIGCIPVGVEAAYLERIFSLELRVACFSIPILPSNKNQKKRKKEPDKTLERSSEKKSAKKKEKPAIFPNGKPDLMELLRFACDLLGDLRRKIRLDVLELHVIFGSDADAAKSAIRYGRAWAWIGALLPMFERIFVIKKRDIGAELDYNNPEKTEIQARLRLTITIGRAISLALHAGIRFLKIYQNMKKGGAANESSSQ